MCNHPFGYLFSRSERVHNLQIGEYKEFAERGLSVESGGRRPISSSPPPTHPESFELKTWHLSMEKPGYLSGHGGALVRVWLVQFLHHQPGLFSWLRHRKRPKNTIKLGQTQVVESGARTPHIYRTIFRALDIKLRRRPRHFMELVAVETANSKLVFSVGELNWEGRGSIILIKHPLTPNWVPSRFGVTRSFSVT